MKNVSLFRIDGQLKKGVGHPKDFKCKCFAERQVSLGIKLERCGNISLTVVIEYFAYGYTVYFAYVIQFEKHLCEWIELLKALV